MSSKEQFRDRWRKLQDALVEAEETHRRLRIIPLGVIVEVLSRSELRLLLESFREDPHNGDYEDVIERIYKRQSPADIASYCYLRVFATLIYYGNEDYLGRAIEFFVQPHEPKCWIPPQDDATRNTTSEKEFYNRLPITQDGVYTNFFKAKLLFCALVLKEDEDNDNPDEQPLPFSVEDGEIIGQGGAGLVYKLMVAKNHYIGKDKQLSNSEEKPLAAKLFKDKPSFTREVEILKKLKGASTISKYVMLPLLSLTSGDHCFLLYDLAEMNLQNLLESRRRTPSDPWYWQETAEILRNLTHLVDALDWIHGPTSPYIQIWHGDIKPDNILVLRDGPKWIWKLADFDHARLRQTFSSSGASQSNSPAPNTYRAPEVTESKAGRRGDVWTMGCMVTLVLSWLYDGPRAFGEFWARRREEDSQHESFCHVSARENWMQNDAVLSPAVSEWMEMLVTRAEPENWEASQGQEVQENPGWYHTYVKFVWENLQREVFVARSDRIYADKFKAFMNEAEEWIPTTIKANASIIGHYQTFETTHSTQNAQNAHHPLNTDIRRGSNNSRTRSMSDEARVSNDSYRNVRSASSQSSPSNFKCSRFCNAIKSSQPPPEDLSETSEEELNDYCRDCLHRLLHQAIECNSRIWVESLLATRKVNINQRDHALGKYTPLAFALRQRNDAIVEILLVNECAKPSKDELRQLSGPQQDTLKRLTKELKAKKK